MLKKIISGGQTGADRAALDTAIKFNIDHGGWMPAGRRAEDGSVPKKYHLREMDTDSYPARTEQNVKDSHGTLIVSRGALSGGSLLTLKIAIDFGKPWCHLDLLSMDEFEAAVMLHAFVVDNAIEILNVAGPRASHAPSIYRSVKAILETYIYMETLDMKADMKVDMKADMKANMKVDMKVSPKPLRADEIFLNQRIPEKICTTIDEAVHFLAGTLPLRTRTLIANSHDRGIAFLYFSMLDAIKAGLGLDSGNRVLFSACSMYHTDYMDIADMDISDVEDAAMLILKALRHFLRQNHVLRVVK